MRSSIRGGHPVHQSGRTINVKETSNILGACNPPLAHRALLNEPSIGLLLPCNVVVRQDAGGSVHVEMMDPAAVLDLVCNPDVNKIAVEVRSRLQRVLAALS